MVPSPARERFDAARLINLANGLTAARVLLVPYFAYLLISGRGKAALLVFAVCGATDALDGILARWLRQRTLVGTLLDPIADKLLMATAFIVLSYVHIAPLRLAIMVISRDIIILTGSLIYLLMFEASDIRATGLSKANTVVQILTVIYFLAIAAFPVEAAALGTGKGTFPDRGVTLTCAVTTVASGLQYLYIGLRKLSNA
ncbi:CDP-alcohol phosphatidyltransferase family protein [Candidatus Deferrimicrobium sp.]|jgi:cardiolipin synthase|uniref:CDP-alcohol phosphatidyltransferase family protein n=1 Tax=Candidatus Deferrimicrobium sp. TaxID=3060586 RepID=UPI002EDBA668